MTARTRLLDTVPRLDVAGVPAVAGLLREQVERDPARAARAELLEYYLSDVTPGASQRAFVEACERMIELAGSETARQKV